MPNTPELVAVNLEWAYRFLGYGPLVLVSTTDGLKPDVSTVAWCAPCAKNPPTLMIAIGKSHKTYRNIMKTGYFGINLPGPEHLDMVMYAGTVSGNDTDKFKQRGLRPWYGQTIGKLPLMQESVAWLECRIVPGVEAGDHSIIIARAEAAWCRPGVLLDDHTWNTVDYPTLHHLGGRRFLVGKDEVLADPVRRSEY